METLLKRKAGRPRKHPKPEDIVGVKTADDGKAVEFPDNAKVENLGLVQPPTLANREFDPFEKHKTDKDKFSYRGLNVRPLNLEKKKAMGWQVVTSEEGGSIQYGDLVLARMPKDLKEAKDRVKFEKSKRASKAVKAASRQELDNMGYKTYDVD